MQTAGTRLLVEVGVKGLESAAGGLCGLGEQVAAGECLADRSGSDRAFDPQRPELGLGTPRADGARVSKDGSPVGRKGCIVDEADAGEPVEGLGACSPVVALARKPMKQIARRPGAGAEQGQGIGAGGLAGECLGEVGPGGRVDRGADGDGEGVEILGMNRPEPNTPEVKTETGLVLTHGLDSRDECLGREGIEAFELFLAATAGSGWLEGGVHGGWGCERVGVEVTR